MCGLHMHEESFDLVVAKWSVRGDEEEGFQLWLSLNGTSFGFVEARGNGYYWIAYVLPENYADIDKSVGWVHDDADTIEEAKSAVIKAIKTNYIMLEVE